MPERQLKSDSPERSEGFSAEEARENEERILSAAMPSVVPSIADALVVKDRDVFFLADPDGNVRLERRHGLGLYYNDCRFLNGYELRIAQTEAIPLVSEALHGFMSVLQLTNQDIRLEGGPLIPKNEIGIHWERIVDGTNHRLCDAIIFRNFGLRSIEFPISLVFRAQFEPVFVVRGLTSQKLGKLRPPSWDGDNLAFSYDGADGVFRNLSIHFSLTPQRKEGGAVHFRIALEPQESRALAIDLTVAESKVQGRTKPDKPALHDIGQLKKSIQRSSDSWTAKHTRIRSNSVLLNRVIDRSVRDLRVLRTSIGSNQFFAAGIPWFATLFGRDSIITALQNLAFNPDIAEQTLRLLARYQGHHTDEWRDEQPGKILHELRTGELAALGEIPHTPYYGTVDATPLFLVLIGRHAAWTGNLSLFNDLRGNIEDALEWITKYGDSDGDGYVEYETRSKKGLINQGWKDSGDAIVDDKGSLAEPPISLVEVQGYVYMAKTALAHLFERVGESERAESLLKEAEELRARFNRDFWLEDKGFYALALQAGKRPASVISSNPGHALWSGIVDRDKAGPTVKRLMAEDMFTGWGIRTLSEKERRYNPIGYHLGTVWPHDNSIIAAGFRRYGFDDEAMKVFHGIAMASTHFKSYRLPEVFAGFAEGEYQVPVSYPVACHPQAWASGSIPYLLETALGLFPEAFENRLRVIRPVLPDFVDSVEVDNLKVGGGRVDLRFDRTEEGVSVRVLKTDGKLDVVIEAD